MTRRPLVAWLANRTSPEAEALQVPEGVEVVDEPRADVTFAVPAWNAAGDLRAMPELEVVQVRSAGVDWIVDDVPPGVTLCSARGTRDAGMAEWVVLALLADVRRVGELARAQGERRWADGVPQRDLAGLRVLILGHGSIGRAVAERLAPFGCEVAGVARRARDGMHGMDELDALLPAADAVVNLLPLTSETQGLVDAATLARMRDGALYVSAGRGATTDTGALLAELQRERLRAVLDVVDPEPLPAGHPLWSAPGVLISPHLAGDSPAGERAAWALVGEQLRRHAAGEPLANVVVDGY
ncbi:MAG TPA: NAD(P)-dependent oxidoreductase [Baekduia sp.]|nr:NAD(P)-dependent oxidoreductase [Baekduia sp.]